MKNLSLKILPTAQTDVQGILDYIAIELCSPGAALKLQDKMLSAFAALQNFPFSGTLVKTIIPLPAPLRWVRVDNYLIYYNVSEERDTVYIVRVRFAAADQSILEEYGDLQ